MLTDLQIHQFVQEIGSDKPAPGGGSASALTGALASSLVKMVANLSGDGQEQIIGQSQDLIEQLLDLVNRDTDAFNQVMASFRMARQTEQERESRRQAIQVATRLATEVPLEIMEVSAQVLSLAEEMVLYGNKNALSDAGVASLLAIAACRGASYNVMINLPSLKDKEFVHITKAHVRKILAFVKDLEQRIAKQVESSLK